MDAMYFLTALLLEAIRFFGSAGASAKGSFARDPTACHDAFDVQRQTFLLRSFIACRSRLSIMVLPGNDLYIETQVQSIWPVIGHGSVTTYCR